MPKLQPMDVLNRCVSKDGLKPVLAHVVHTVTKSGDAFLVATDTARLAYHRTLKNPKWKDGQTRVAVTGEILEGNFPQWERILPTVTEKLEITFQPKSLTLALKSVLPIGRETAHWVKLKVFEDGVTLETHKTDGVKACVKLEATVTTDLVGFEIAFNGTFLKDCLSDDCKALRVRFAQDERVVCYRARETKPFEVMVIGGACDGLGIVIMPMALKSK